ncbi:beta-ketoacyl synthase [Enterobacteriaceae bacterium YMB-R22]|uniref:beta-ketoacyl synthase N-terminal-like domain-containing protein n=1 Tax=Tenebrionicola larvae TaxID=2815733 RepID=UPI00201164E4|nr:beta-ketoacyl synthase N-terminal-like domain-containing protein [Tenebrionicola larvae]MBV4413071.1 beta-ketoacyl synthase [Tenebrionicola larvae]
MENATILSGYSVRLAYAEDSETLIDNLRCGGRVEKTYWFDTDAVAIRCGLKGNKFTARLPIKNDDVFDGICETIDRALDKAMLDKRCLAGDNVRVYLTGLGPRVDVIDYAAFYDHNDIEDVTLTKSVQNLHASKMSQDKLAADIAKRYSLKTLPPNMHCTSNSSLSAVHLGCQAIGSGGVDVVLVVNCSQIKTQDIYFLESQSMLDSVEVQPFGEDSKSVLFAEGFCAVVLESARHRAARQLAGGIRLTSTYAQISAGRSNDAAQLSANLLKVMNKALEKAGVGCDSLCAVIPHANGSETSDKAEALAIASLLSEQSVPVLAYKGQIGYTTTGSGIVDLIIGQHTLSHGELLSPVGTMAIRENVAQHVLLNKGVVKHNKHYLLKMGLGVDGSIVGMVMSDASAVNG